jgi:hypothetical protein
MSAVVAVLLLAMGSVPLPTWLSTSLLVLVSDVDMRKSSRPVKNK